MSPDLTRQFNRLTRLSLPAINRPPSFKVILILLALLSPLVIYFNTIVSMVAIWNRSDTFTHQYTILPISLWLIWRRRKVLAQMPLQPYWPALLLLAVCGFAWLLGTLAGVQGVRQYAMVGSVVTVALSLFGRRISWAIAFPLLFLFLAVPFGEIFIDPLINFTANFTIAALRATGIPVLREGNSFVIPSGRWSVVEACSGVRYLIASVTLGLLYAYLTYRSRWRRTAFVAVSVAVPIVANGVRAYMIVMIGHLSGMKLAVGVDHLIYGWLFFGLVMFLMFWIGGFWYESDGGGAVALHDVPRDLRAVAAKNVDGNAAPRASMSDARLVIYVVGIVACIGIWPLYASQMEKASFNPTWPDLAQFQSASPEQAAFTDWKAAFTPPAATLYRYYREGENNIGLGVFYYRNQQQGSSLISSANRILPEKFSTWNQLGRDVRIETMRGRQLTMREEMIQSMQNPSESLLVWHCYWIDGRFVENDYLGKVLLTREKLLMRGDDGVALTVFAPYVNNPEQARDGLRRFLDANLASLETIFANNKKP